MLINKSQLKNIVVTILSDVVVAVEIAAAVAAGASPASSPSSPRTEAWCIASIDADGELDVDEDGTNEPGVILEEDAAWKAEPWRLPISRCRATVSSSDSPGA